MRSIWRPLAHCFAPQYGRRKIADQLREMLARKPFRPVRVRVTSGRTHLIRNPHTVVVMKSTVVIARPAADRVHYVELSQVAAVEAIRTVKRRRGT